MASNLSVKWLIPRLKLVKANKQAFPNMCYYQQEQCRRYYSPSWYDFDRFRIKCSGDDCRLNGKCRKKADSRVRLCPSTDACPGGSICLENIDTYIQHCQCPQSYTGSRCEMLLVISGIRFQKMFTVWKILFGKEIENMFQIKLWKISQCQRRQETPLFGRLWRNSIRANFMP